MLKTPNVTHLEINSNYEMFNNRRLFGLYFQLVTIGKLTRWLLIVALLAGSASACGFPGRKLPGHNLEALCSGRRTHLTKYSQLRLLVVKLDGNPRACASSNIPQALVSLENLIEADLSDVCSMASVDRFNEFMESYMDKPAGESLPWSLRRFVLAYGEQMSNVCKENMVAQLTSGHQLTDADHNQIDRLICDGCPLSRIIDEESKLDPDAELTPNDLIRLMRPGDLGRKVYVQMATGQTIWRIQMICNRRFKPIYNPLLEPLAKMAHLGFNYISVRLRDQLRVPKVSSNIRRWSRVILSCESVERLVMVPGDPEEFRLAEEAASHQMIRVLTEQEANEIWAQWANSNSTSLRAHEERFDDRNFSLDPSQLTRRPDPVAMHIDRPEGAKRWPDSDVVVDESNKALMAAVERLMKGKKQILNEETIKSMLSVRSLRLLRNAIEDDRIGLVFSPLIEKEVKNFYKDFGATVGGSRKAMTLALFDELIKLKTKKTSRKRDELRFTLICKVFPVVAFVAITAIVSAITFG